MFIRAMHARSFSDLTSIGLFQGHYSTRGPDWCFVNESALATSAVMSPFRKSPTIVRFVRGLNAKPSVYKSTGNQLLEPSKNDSLETKGSGKPSELTVCSQSQQSVASFTGKRVIRLTSLMRSVSRKQEKCESIVLQETSYIRACPRTRLRIS